VNQINIIIPYIHRGQWVFDDMDKGLKREPFVGGSDLIIDKLTQGISGADTGFILMFSSGPFPEAQSKFTWIESGHGGNWYSSESFGMNGWLCPALLKYFDEAPKELYVRARGIK